MAQEGALGQDCVSPLTHPPGGSDLASSLLLGDKPEGTEYPISGHTFGLSSQGGGPSFWQL